MQTGWIKLDNAWYDLDSSGKILADKWVNSEDGMSLPE